MPDDYPATLLEFERRFSTEEACRDYLVRLRWAEGFRCPRCGSSRAWPRTRGGLMECADCSYKASATAGTIFDRTRIPMHIWFRAMWLLTSQKNGASALGLQRQLGLKRYEMIWTMLHKLRRAMVRPGRELLSGKVEVDETYVGGKEEGVHGRETTTKSLVAIAVEEDGDGVGRIRLRAEISPMRCGSRSEPGSLWVFTLCSLWLLTGQERSRAGQRLQHLPILRR